MLTGAYLTKLFLILGVNPEVSVLGNPVTIWNKLVAHLLDRLMKGGILCVENLMECRTWHWPALCLTGFYNLTIPPLLLIYDSFPSPRAAFLGTERATSEEDP